MGGRSSPLLVNFGPGQELATNAALGAITLGPKFTKRGKAKK